MRRAKIRREKKFRAKLRFVPELQTDRQQRVENVAEKMVARRDQSWSQSATMMIRGWGLVIGDWFLCDEV